MTTSRPLRRRPAKLEELLPSFRTRVAQLIERLRAAGYEPVLFETLRSPERALELARRGKGIADSMHLYGAAADLICKHHGWDCAEHRCGFFDALGAAAESLGLTWGGRFPRVDKPHVQGLTVGEQPRFRRLKNALARDAFVRARLDS